MTGTAASFEEIHQPLNFRKSSLPELETRLEEIDEQLQQLARYTLRSGVGPIGYRTYTFFENQHTEWFQINWERPQAVEEVILVPTLHRDKLHGLRTEGFPEEFRIFLGTAAETNGTKIASFTAQDGLLPRIAPLIVTCRATTASWIRVEASVLSSRSFDDRYVFQLSEIMVFSGQKNVALKGAVTTSSECRGAPAWSPDCLADGFLPYLMDSADGDPSDAVMSAIGEGHPAMLTIDLGELRTIDRIHLHATGQNEDIPQQFDERYGIPRHLRIEGSSTPDFTDTELLLDFKQKSLFDVGSIIARNIPPKTCRYVRLIAQTPYVPENEQPWRTRFGFAEVELFEGDTNVALHKPVTANFETENRRRRPAALTDGRNYYGDILPIRVWLNQLALRHELEKERPLVAQELTRRYLLQKTYLLWTGGLAALFGICALSIAVVDRFMRRRAVDQTRKRIAADLHDELGANVQAIGLLSTLAQMHLGSPGELSSILTRMQQMTRRTGLAARYCTNTLEAKELYADLVEDMRHTTERIVADIDHRLSFEGEEELRRLKPQKRIDLFLFYKEALINVIRHSGATQVSANICMTPKTLCLTVSDNGHGLDGDVPESLKRRAKLLRAKVTATRPAEGGTCIRLTLKINRRNLEKKTV